MKSIIFGLSLAAAATAQIVNGVSMIPATDAAVATASVSESSSAPASEVTAPPTTSSVDFYASEMPYSKYKEGGYKSLECGYGWKKSEDGSCTKEGWVRLARSVACRATSLNAMLK